MKKISRKDISKMSTRQFLLAAMGPYWKLASYLKPYKARFILGIVFGALYGIVNGGMVWVIKFVTEQVFAARDSGAELKTIVEKLPQEPETVSAFNTISDAIDGMGVTVGLSGPILLVAALVPVIMVLRGLCGYLNSYCMLWVSTRVLSDIRTQLFGKMMNQSLDFYNKQKGGEMIQTVFNQTRMAQQALTTMASDMVKQPISILSALVVLFIIDWKFTLVALVLFPLCIVPVSIVGRNVRKAGGKEEEEAGMLMVVMQEAFAGIRVVKSHGREAYELQRFTTANNNMMKLMMRWRKAMEMVGPMVESVASLGVAAALVYVAIRPDLGAAHFIALNAGFVMMYPPAKSLSRIHILMQKCLAATTKVFDLMERVPSIMDAPDAVEISEPIGDIKFRKVTFAYGKHEDAVSEIDLVIPEGKTFAFVGESGAGKSTLFSLMMRFYDPREGTISIGGTDIRKIKQPSLRDNLGIVNQDVFLFHDTIYENIRYGMLDATREQIEEAAKQAHAHEFIIQQEKGYDTMIGDKGCTLSGGQQQRLSIARAILRNAPVLLLDEAFSALDSESEKKVQEAVDVLSSGKTVIAIAHRLSTVLKADQIVVMDKGRIVDIGPHSELLENSEIYRRLYNMQFHDHTIPVEVA
jgi:subfamily B ATP-binding cassette protein MsbA